MDFWSVFVMTVTSLFPIINPVGNAPFFMAYTAPFPLLDRHRLASRVAVFSFFLLFGTLVFGDSILDFFDLSVPIVRIAGGFVVFHTAWGMLNSNPKLSKEEESETAAKAQEIAFFPLTMPLTAGAGSIAITLAVGAQLSHRFAVQTFLEYGGALAGMLVLAGCIFVSYRYADWLFGTLGKVGTNVVTKLSAFLLLAVAVSIVWKGVQGIIPMASVAK